MDNVVFRKTYGLYVRPNTSDDFICDEAQDYEPLLINANNNDALMDIGAYIGSTSKMVKDKFPEMYIHCYEPDLENFNLASQNLQRYNNITLYNSAVGIGDKAVKLYQNTGTFKAKHSKAKRDKLSSSTYVHQCDFRSHLNFNDISLIKCDCEGGEYDMDFINLPDRVKGVAIEIHLINDNHRQMVELYRTLKKQFPFQVGEIPKEDNLDYFKKTYKEKDAAFMVIFLRNI